MKYHIQDLNSPCSLTTLCGRRVGTSGGKIYPGVHAETPAWYDEHPYPEALNGVVCRQCRKD